MSATQTTPATNDSTELRPPDSVFTIDIRGIISPFHAPSLTEVIAAVEAAVPQPQVPLVFEGWGHAKGTYTIETFDPIPVTDIAKIKLPCSKTSNDFVELTVQPLPKRIRDKRETTKGGGPFDHVKPCCSRLAQNPS